MLKNDYTIIQIKCEDGAFFFFFFLSKDGSNLKLVVKTLIQDHNYYRIFTNLTCIKKFLAYHYKGKIMAKRDYKVKDLRKEVEDELKVNVT